jgi:hypothetical protein
VGGKDSCEQLFEDCVSLVQIGDSSDVLWHYTSTEALIRILESSSLHLICYRFMNDPSEGRLASALVEACWQNALARAVDHPRLDIDWLRKHCCVPALDYPGTDDQSTFVFSGSTRRDLLSQWARYGDDGRGVALGLEIDTNALRFGTQKGSWLYGPYLSRVAYWSPTTSGSDTEAIPGTSSTALVGMLSDRLYEFLMRAENGIEIENGLLMVAEGLTPSIKASGYAEEHEVRISAQTDLHSKASYRLKASRHGIAPVVELPLHGAGVRLTSVLVGPRLGPETLWSLRWLKEKYDLKTLSILPSNLSYR